MILEARDRQSLTEVLIIASAGWAFDVYEGQIFNLTRDELLKELIVNDDPAAKESMRKFLGDVFLGIYLAGGGSLLRGLDKRLHLRAKLTVHVAEDPLTAVARGAGVILTNIDSFEDSLIENEDELPFIP